MQGRHNRWLDAVRGLSAQVVLVGHTVAAIAPHAPVNSGLAWFSRAAVVTFFVLSGFAIVGSLSSEVRRTGGVDLTGYAIRRAARILPPYFFTVAFVYAFFFATAAGNALFSEYNAGLAAALRSFVFLFTSRDPIVVTPVWSLRIEVGLYILAALVAAAYLSAGRTRIVFGVAAAVIAALMAWRLTFAVLGMVAFAAGGAAAAYAGGIREAVSKPALYALVPMVFLPSVWLLPDQDGALGQAYQCVVAVMIALALAFLSKAPSHNAVDMAARTGAWSYTLYLIHMPIILVVASFMSGIAAIITSLMIANLASWGSALVIERADIFRDSIRSVLTAKRA